MRHQVDGRQLGRTASHRRALMKNMASSLILSGRIETTLVKAKELRKVADRLVTWAKRGDLHARRQAARHLHRPEALQKLFADYGPRFKERNGGYTRIFRLEQRRGDAAPMAFIEYLGYELPAKVKKAEPQDTPPKKAKKDSEKPKKKAAEKTEKAPVKKEEKTEAKSKKRGLFGLGRKKKEE